MQSLDIIAKDMSPKNKIKKFLKDMPSFLSEGRWATGNQNATIALALAGVETAYNNLKERYRVSTSRKWDRKVANLTPSGIVWKRVRPRSN